MAHIVTPDDVNLAARQMLETLSPVLDRDWSIPAHGLEWSCRYTLDHTVNALVMYSMNLATRSPSRRSPLRGPIEGQPVPQILTAVESAAAILAEVCKSAPDDVRGFHGEGMADWSGYIGMGCTEILLHTDDIARGFGIEFQADEALSRRVVDRLFPWAPQDGDGWQVLRWATGRTALPDREQVGTDWSWQCSPLAEWDGNVKTGNM